jgi:hypothetical protein
MVMVLNDNFNTISVISWWSALLLRGTGVPGEQELSQSICCFFYRKFNNILLQLIKQ